MDNVIDIKSIFKLALEQTISNYAETARLEISKLILHICGNVRSYMVVTDAGAESLSEEIFTNELYRDFIFNLLFNFCPRLSFTNPESEFNKLINSFSFTLAIGEYVKTDFERSRDTGEHTNKLPEDILKRLPTKQMIRNLLINNKWLMMVLLISLYISIEDFESMTNEKKG